MYEGYEAYLERVLTSVSPLQPPTILTGFSLGISHEYTFARQGITCTSRIERHGGLYGNTH